MHDDETPTLLEAARPLGSGYQNFDRRLVEEMLDRVRAGTATTWARAAWAIVGRAHGIGTEGAKVRRLVALAKSIYGQVCPESPFFSIIQRGTEAGESDSLAGMIAHATPHQQPALAALQARLIQIEAERDELLGIVTNQHALLERQQRLVAEIYETERKRTRRAVRVLARNIVEADHKVTELETRQRLVEAEMGVSATRH